MPVCDPYKTARNNGIHAISTIFIVYRPLRIVSVRAGIILNLGRERIVYSPTKFESAYT